MLPSFILQYQASGFIASLITQLEELLPVQVPPLEQERLQDQLGIEAELLELCSQFSR